MARRKKRRGGSGIIWFLLFLVLAGLIYLYISQRRVVDYTVKSQEINDGINEVLVDLGITDADILKVYREEKQERNKKWIQVTKEIKAPARADLAQYQKVIAAKVKKLRASVISSDLDKSQYNLTIKIGVKKIVMQTLIFSKIGGRRIAIIIDDLGYDENKLAKFLALKVPLSLSILPGEKFSQRIASEVIAKGYHILLHLPMEPYGYPGINPGARAVLTTMSDSKIEDMVKKDIKSVPGVAGVNNHMGSKFTENPRKMEQVLKVIKQSNLFYVDSRTSANSIAYETARRIGVKTAERQIFLDNKDDLAYIKGQLQQLANSAIKHGQAIGIGHFQREMTAEAISEMLPEFKKQNVQIVFVSDLVR
ncbi:MAG: divergent polysaccharide deacetylase family protein [bacterium]